MLDRKTIDRLNKKLQNGFKICLQTYASRGEKWVELTIPYGEKEKNIVLIAHIYFDYQKIPTLSVLTYQKKINLFWSIGNAKYKSLGNAQTRRNFNLLAQLTQDWDEKKIVEFWEDTDGEKK